ncbi:hypothetical protein [Streptomyces sp. NPDC059949]|uniref:hypothetical protein n=1 Tax=Streptomyces sp. NPDC059949 TaxID=3347013 RepID=UPI0036685CD6
MSSALLGGLLGVAGGGAVGWTVFRLVPPAGVPAPDPGAAGAACLVVIAGLGAMSVPERRKRRRVLALAERLDEEGRTLWGPVAERITEHEARAGDPIPDAVQQHFTEARHALSKRDGRRALAALRHATVRMAIVLRPVVRAHPDDVLLAQALRDILVVRDQVVAQVVENRVALV